MAVFNTNDDDEDDDDDDDDDDSFGKIISLLDTALNK